MISEDLLVAHNAKLVTYHDGTRIFSEDEAARFYFQLKSGGVKMFNLNENGKEFVQGLFYDGDSFGEPPLLGTFNYPATAVSVGDSQIYKLKKKSFFGLLESNYDTHFKFTETLANRLAYKAMILKEMSVHPPEHRILRLVDYLKEKYGNKEMFQVDLTRQQIADLTGLRVETVIRAFKQLETDGEIKIINRRIYR
jgi:CRP-like cAMP-binding protein